MSPIYAIHLFAGFLLALTALLTLVKRRFDRYTRPFLFFILVHLIGIAAVCIEASQQTSLWTVGYYLLYFYVTFLPFAWYLMASQWGVDKKEHSRSKIFFTIGLFAISVIIFFYIIMTRAVDLGIEEKFWFLELGPLKLWISAYIILGVTAGAYALEVCYRSSLGLSREKIKRSFFPLLAYAIALLGMATVGILYGRIGDLLLAVCFLLAALISLPVARHYILFNPVNDGIILTRRGIYSSITVILVGVYFLIIGSIGEVLLQYNLDYGVFFWVVTLILMVVTFMILVVSQALRSRFQGVASHQAPFSRKSPYAAEWKEFSEEVSVSLDMEAIYSQTRQLLDRLLKIDKTVFVIKEAAPSENYTLYSEDSIDRGIPGNRLHRAADWLYRFGHPIEMTTMAEKSLDEARQLQELEKTLSCEFFLVVPFVARQQSLGFWGIGRHSSGRALSSDEIGFIEAAANPVALTILGARMTDELVVSREIASFHRISAFVLHDLKNSVAMLSMLLQNAEKNISNPQFQKEALVTIQKAVNRQRRIISRLTDEKSEEKLSYREIDLADLIARTLERVSIESVAGVKTTVSVDGGLRVFVDPDKIGSVFDNLIMNAVEAMPDGGTIDIRSRQSDIPGFVVISFKDSGNGMDQEFISTRLFKPFSSTKSYGLGIGMYQSREILTAHKAKIDVISEPGKGTEFIIYLPGVN